MDRLQGNSEEQVDISIFTYLSVLYDVVIEASACVLSSRYAMLCYAMFV